MASSQDKAGSQEPAKAAKLLSDITAVGLEIDLSGLNVVEADEEYLQNASNQVETLFPSALYRTISLCLTVPLLLAFCLMTLSNGTSVLQVHVQAKGALRAGMETLSQAEVGSALQIYFNLNKLPKVKPCTLPVHPRLLSTSLQAKAWAL